MLLGDKIMDIAEYAVPWHWQRTMCTMCLHGFEPVMHTDSEFVKFCKQMEFTKLPMEPLTNLKSNQNGKGPTTFGKSPAMGHFNSQDWKQKLDYWDHYCVLHQTKSHDTSECKVILEQAKQMQTNYDTHKQGYTNLFKKPANDFKKAANDFKKTTHEEHHQISCIVESYLAKKAKKIAPPENTPKQVNLTEFTNLHLDMCDSPTKNASDSDSDDE